MQAVPLTILSLALAIAFFGASRRVMVWRRGAPGMRPGLRSLISIPRRYLVDVHEVVARDRASSRMHVGAAGGTLLGALLSAAIALGLVQGIFIALGLGVVCTAGALGAALDIRRRGNPTVGRFSAGQYQWLPWLLIGANVFLACTGMLGAMAVPVAWNSVIGLILFGLGCFTLLPLAWMLAAGPMRHALAGALHLAWHPRPERFGSTAATGLRLVDLDATQVGVGRSTDFTWNQILGFDACVQCGRCEAVCPANAAGLPLNPKKLINDLIGNIAPIHYAGNPHPGIPASSEASGSELVVGQKAPVSQETLWACTTCRACVEACPMLIEHVDAVIDMRRFQTLELAATPGKAPEVLAASAETDTCSGRPVSERLNFASDLGLPRLTQGVPVDILLWLGDSAFNTRNQRSLRALLKVLKQAQLSFAVLDDEADCGDTCRRLGDEFEFNRLAAGNIERLRAFQFARIVTLDPHVAHCLKVEYPALGGNYSVLHHTALLAELLEQRVLAVQQSPNLKVTYHDPCYLSRYLGQTEAARNIIAKSGMDFVEMQRHGRQSFCCGAGGGASITDVAGKRRIPDLRMEQACDTGAEIVLVACPNCTNMLEGATVKGPRVMEISEYLLEHLLPDTGPAATYVRINPADSSLNKVSA